MKLQTCQICGKRFNGHVWETLCDACEFERREHAYMVHVGTADGWEELGNGGYAKRILGAEN